MRSWGWKSCGFFSDKWMGDKYLKNLFPKLFVLTTDKEGLVKDIDFWNDDNWV